MVGLKRTYSGPSKVLKVAKFQKRYVKKSQSNANLLRQLKKQMINKANKKHFDTTPGAAIYALGDTYTFTLLNNIIEGTDEDTRIGRNVKISSIQLNGIVQSASNTTGSGYIRTIIVQDMQPNAAIFAITSYLVSDDLVSLRNTDNTKRFKTLHSEILPISGFGTQANGTPTTQCVDWYKKVNIITDYNATNGGTIADITKNSLYLLTIATGFATTVLFNDLRIRLKFSDLN